MSEQGRDTEWSIEDLWRELQELEEGRLGDRERDALFDLLDRSAEARGAYLEYFEQVAMLEAEATTRAEQGLLPRVEPRAPDRSLFRRSMLAAAAALVLLAAIGALIQTRMPAQETLAATAAPESEWAVDGEAIEPGGGHEIHEGSIVAVSSGLVKLDFEDGAGVILQGPATASFPRLDQPVLSSGWLWLDSGPEGREFCVTTPAGEIRNMGTRYGIRVGSGELTEIHLVEGVLELRRSATSGQPVTIRSGDTALLVHQDGQREEIELAPDPFPGVAKLLETPLNYPGTILAQTPMGYWRLDEPVTGELANEVAASPAAMSTEVVLAGKPGVGPATGYQGFPEGNRSMQLDGNSLQSVIHRLAGSHGVSKREGAVSFWIRRQPGLGAPEALWVAGDPMIGSVDGGDGLYAYLSEAGHLGLFVENGRYDVLLSSRRNVADGSWHHVVASWGASAVDLYLDGRRIAQDSEFRAEREGLFEGTDVRFGKVGNQVPVPGRAVEGYNGWVDELAVWDRPLSEPEVAHQYRAGFGPGGK